MNAADVLAVDSPDEEIAVTLHLYDEFGERPWTGYDIIGPEKARRRPRVHSISRRPFSIERSLFLRRKQAISVIQSITYLLWAALSSHML